MRNWAKWGECPWRPRRLRDPDAQRRLLSSSCVPRSKKEAHYSFCLLELPRRQPRYDAAPPGPSYSLICSPCCVTSLSLGGIARRYVYLDKRGTKEKGRAPRKVTLERVSLTRLLESLMSATVRGFARGADHLAGLGTFLACIAPSCNCTLSAIRLASPGEKTTVRLVREESPSSSPKMNQTSAPQVCCWLRWHGAHRARPF